MSRYGNARKNNKKHFLYMKVAGLFNKPATFVLSPFHYNNLNAIKAAQWKFSGDRI
jgi:hypothetical protein